MLLEVRPQVRIGTRGRRSGVLPSPTGPGPGQDLAETADARPRGSGRARRFRVTPHSGPETRVNSIAFSVHPGSFRLVQRHLDRGPFPTGTKRPPANGSSPSPPARATGARPDTSRGGPWRGSASAWPRSSTPPDQPVAGSDRVRTAMRFHKRLQRSPRARPSKSKRRAAGSRVTPLPPGSFQPHREHRPAWPPLDSWWSRSTRFGARQSGSGPL